jgi:hypothetical protein
MQNPPGWDAWRTLRENKMTRQNIPQNKKRSHPIIGTPVHTSKGKVIGQVLGDVFVKDMTTAHILDKFNAIASDICTLHEAERAGANYVEFTNTDDGIIYRSPIAKFWDCGKFIDFGYGSQQMLGLAHFEHRRDPNYESHTDTDPQGYTSADSTHAEPKMLFYKSRATVGVKFKKGKPRQLDFFGGRE